MILRMYEQLCLRQRLNSTSRFGDWGSALCDSPYKLFPSFINSVTSRGSRNAKKCVTYFSNTALDKAEDCIFLLTLKHKILFKHLIMCKTNHFYLTSHGTIPGSSCSTKSSNQAR